MSKSRWERFKDWVNQPSASQLIEESDKIFEDAMAAARKVDQEVRREKDEETI